MASYAHQTDVELDKDLILTADPNQLPYKTSLDEFRFEHELSRPKEGNRDSTTLYASRSSAPGLVLRLVSDRKAEIKMMLDYSGDPSVGMKSASRTWAFDAKDQARSFLEARLEWALTDDMQMIGPDWAFTQDKMNEESRLALRFFVKERERIVDSLFSKMQGKGERPGWTLPEVTKATIVPNGNGA